jgi:hypothetical protein
VITARPGQLKDDPPNGAGFTRLVLTARHPGPTRTGGSPWP